MLTIGSGFRKSPGIVGPVRSSVHWNEGQVQDEFNLGCVDHRVPLKWSRASVDWEMEEFTQGDIQAERLSKLGGVLPAAGAQREVRMSKGRRGEEHPGMFQQL